jgi:chemotaxis protein CheD
MSDNEPNIINVAMSDMKTASNGCILRSRGIGSCIAVTLYDPAQRVGAMAHPMLALPNNSQLATGNSYNKKEKELPVTDYGLQVTNLRYVESAIDAMIVAVERLGASKERLEAKIVGGANMFEVFHAGSGSIGDQNVEAAKTKLEREGITIVTNDTGGNIGRSMTLDLTTGLAEVKTKV